MLGSQSLARGNPSRSSRPSTKSSSVGIYGKAHCGDGGTGLILRTRRRGGDWISGRGPVKTSKSARSDSNRARLSSRRSVRFVGRGLCHRTVKHHFESAALANRVHFSESPCRGVPAIFGYSKKNPNLNLLPCHDRHAADLPTRIVYASTARFCWNALYSKSSHFQCS
jgi:hypothetical protein